MSMTEDELRAAFAAAGRGFNLLVWPGPDRDLDPEGRIVIDGRGETWSVFQFTHGAHDRHEFASKDEAIDFTYRRWVLRGRDV